MIPHLGDIEFISIDLLEKRQADCQSNSSIFVLDGNSGVIWHLESGQCLHTKLRTELVHEGPVYPNSQLNFVFVFLYP